MQPELPSSENEKTQSEPGVSQNVTPVAESLGPTLAVKVEAQKLPIAQKKPSKWNMLYIVLGILILLIFATSVWTGYWAYMLSTDLTSTQQQLTALQAEHEKLQADYTALSNTNDQLTKDLAQSKADLEKANTDLATAQSDLKITQDKNKSLTTKIDKAGKLSNILYIWFTSNKASDVFEIDTQIKATNDTQLKSIWKDLISSQSEDKLGEFVVYLVTTIRDGLK